MQSCTLWVSAFLLTDVKKLPNTLTGGASWACDGCIQGWIRDVRPMALGKAVCEAHLAEAFGAPADVVANLEQVVARRRARYPQIDAQFKEVEGS